MSDSHHASPFSEIHIRVTGNPLSGDRDVDFERANLALRAQLRVLAELNRLIEQGLTPWDAMQAVSGQVTKDGKLLAAMASNKGN
jgi:hypothetical protein